MRFAGSARTAGTSSQSTPTAAFTQAPSRRHGRPRREPRPSTPGRSQSGPVHICRSEGRQARSGTVSLPGGENRIQNSQSGPPSPLRNARRGYSVPPSRPLARLKVPSAHISKGWLRLRANGQIWHFGIWYPLRRSPLRPPITTGPLYRATATISRNFTPNFSRGFYIPHIQTPLSTFSFSRRSSLSGGLPRSLPPTTPRPPIIYVVFDLDFKPILLLITANYSTGRKGINLRPIV